MSEYLSLLPWNILAIIFYLPLFAASVIAGLMIHEWNTGVKDNDKFDFSYFDERAKRLFIFLDLDGVLSNRESYQRYQEAIENTKNKHPSTKLNEIRRNKEKVKDWNEKAPNDILLFKDKMLKGEIIDKRILDKLHEVINGLGYSRVDVVLTSSGSVVLEGLHPTKESEQYFSIKYYSELLNWNILDFIRVYSGTGKSRYDFMVNWLTQFHNEYPTERWEAIMLEDMELNQENNLGFYQVKHHEKDVEKIMIEIESMLQDNDKLITDKNFNHFA